MKTLLQIKDLYVNAEEKEILKGLNLTINKGEIHVIMGPNGAGKSTLANVILNNPEYTKIKGTVELEGENINSLSTDQIAKKGVFITTSYFAKPAIEYANNQNIILIDGQKLVQLMIKYNVGCYIENNYSIKKLDLDFFENI